MSALMHYSGDTEATHKALTLACAGVAGTMAVGLARGDFADTEYVFL